MVLENYQLFIMLLKLTNSPLKISSSMPISRFETLAACLLAEIF
jgi:hypothetical protein